MDLFFGFFNEYKVKNNLIYVTKNININVFVTFLYYLSILAE